MASRRSPRLRDPARRVAYDVLRAVDTRDAYANLLLPALLRERGITGRDAALATELTYGTLRGRGSYDAVLDACTDRPLEQVDPPLLDVLRLGAHQLLATRIPPHAAVAASVELVRATLGERQVRFANAVLRKVSSRDLMAWLAIAAPDRVTDPEGYLAVAYSHPRWVVTAFREALGGDLGETEALLAADNERPEVCVAAKPGLASRDELVSAGGKPAPYSPYAVVLPEGDPAGVPAVREGRATVQDEGSQLVAVAAATAEVGGPGDSDGRWLDVCAGPGGKAALLAGLASDRRVRLVAADVAPHRARLVRQAVTNPAGARGADVLVADGTRSPWRAGVFDRVLVDVPCTGLGALRRRPEARWRRGQDSIASLGQVQRRLLVGALDAARPGGVVAYVTCSPHLAETSGVVADVLAGRGDARQLEARPLLPGVPDLGPGPDVRLWPHRHGTDALYLALLRREQ